MENSFQQSLLKVCTILNKHRVEYLVVGGTAVALYGFYRMSITSLGTPADKPDLDFWYNPTYKNYFNLLNAIEDLGENVSAFRREKTPNPGKSFFKLNFDEFTIDFLPELPGLSKFRYSFKKKEELEVDGVAIYFINFDDLITNKLSMSREKDLTDLEALKRIHNNDSK